VHIQSAASTEYVRVGVGATANGVAIDPTADNLQMAFVPAGNTPAGGDWKAATWETDATVTPPVYYARCLVGPAPGLITLTANTIYDVFVKVTDNPEVVVRNTGGLGIL